jgi:NAD(P)-dependent dehydrogenase (short-subunit alcohol dehydrogenase family)
MRLAARRVLVTGAASGIGLATAELFREQGAKVALLDIDATAVRAAAERMGRDRVVAVVADVAAESQVRAAVHEAARELGGLDGIVSAAGVDLMRPFTETSSAEWNRLLAINLTGPMLVCAAALPALRAAGGGTIVTIASGAGLRPLDQRTAYCASKAGLVMFSKALAIDLAPFGIRVNAVCPGIVDTPLFRRTYERAPDPDAELDRILGRYVIKRVGQPRDIAHAALYLTCDESAHVTGIALAVDGGRTFH